MTGESSRERPDALEPDEHEEENELPRSEQIRRAHEDRSRVRRKTTKHRERASSSSSQSKQADGAMIAGRIIRAEGKYFVAELPDGSELRVKSSKPTIASDANATLVTIGDRVQIQPTAEGVPLIAKVEPRRTRLLRRATGRNDEFAQVIVANIDLIVIVASILEPPIRPGIIDRYIVAAIDGGLDVLILINKSDLANTSAAKDAGIANELDYFVNLYRTIGYLTYAVSANDPKSVGEVRQVFESKTSVFVGHSGVGKSSLVNALLGGTEERTGTLSRKYRRGAHTTSRSVLLPFGDLADTFVVDTPGVREFTNYDVESEQLKFFFVEFSRIAEQCAITNCSHLHEPGCAVIAAVEAGKIAPERYASYQKLYEESSSREKRLRERT